MEFLDFHMIYFQSCFLTVLEQNKSAFVYFVRTRKATENVIVVNLSGMNCSRFEVIDLIGKNLFMVSQGFFMKRFMRFFMIEYKKEIGQLINQ